MLWRNLPKRRRYIAVSPFYAYHMARRLSVSTTGDESLAAVYTSSNIDIYSYVINHDREGDGNVAGALLYAKTDETVTPDEDFNMGGNPISQRTLDLGSDWGGITTQLEALCHWLEGQ